MFFLKSLKIIEKYYFFFLLIILSFSLFFLKEININNINNISRSLGIINFFYYLKGFFIIILSFISISSFGKLCSLIFFGEKKRKIEISIFVYYIIGYCTASIFIFFLFFFGFFNLKIFLFFYCITLFFFPIFFRKKLIIFHEKIKETKTIQFIILSFVILFFCFKRFSFLGESTTDVWEHYLPYFSVFKQTYGTYQNDLTTNFFTHFFISKQQSLKLVLTLIFDEFAIVYLSILDLIVLIFLAGSVLNFITKTDQYKLPLIIICLFYYSQTHNYFEVSLIKHHISASMLIFFNFYLIILYFYKEEKDFLLKKLLIFLGVSITFINPHYLPIIFIGNFFCIICNYNIFKKNLNLFIYLNFSYFLGFFLVVGINYYMAGLPLDVPLNIIWDFLDHSINSKINSLWGENALDIFRYKKIGGIDQSTFLFSEQHFFDLTRLKFLKQFNINLSQLVLFIIIFLLLILILFKKKILSKKKYSDEFFCFLSFFIPIIIFGLLYNQSSIVRVYHFIVIIYLLCIFFTISLISLKNLRKKFVLVVSFFISLFFISYDYKKNSYIGNYNKIINHYSGRVSFIDSFETRKGDDLNNIYNFLNKNKSLIKNEFYLLSYKLYPIQAYIYPKLSLHEPNFALGPDVGDIYFSDANKTVRLLKKKKINYFIINLDSIFFYGLVLSDLFQYENVIKYLQPVFINKNFYILTWKNKSNKLEFDKNFSLNYKNFIQKDLYGYNDYFQKNKSTFKEKHIKNSNKF